MLTLPIKRYWYDMIVNGDKPVEYREPSDYWTKRCGFKIVGKNSILVAKSRRIFVTSVN